MEYDCQKCGACCTGLDVLLDEDEARFFASQPELNALTRWCDCPPGTPRMFMKRDRETDTCLALEGPDGDVRCTIYEARPRLCHELQPGDPHCLESRRNAGLPE